MAVTRRRLAVPTMASASAICRVYGITQLKNRTPVAGLPLDEHFITSHDYNVIDPGLSNLTRLACNFPRPEDNEPVDVDVDVDVANVRPTLLDPASYRIQFLTLSLCFPLV